MITIVDVARKAGVSVSTVSKVLKNYPNISAATRKKVLEATEELGYVPNAMASALSSKQYNKVAIWININNQRQAIDEISMQYILGAFHRSKELGLNMIPLFSEMFKEDDVNDLIRHLKSQGVTGLIVYGLNKHNQNVIDLIDKKEFYCVVVDAPNVNDKTSSVTVDNFTAQYEVAKKTLDHNICSKVLYLAGRADGYVTDMRLAGIQRLQREMGFDLDVQFADFSEKKAREITFEKGKDTHAIVCASDLMAIGAKNALQEMDIFRPVCGFDGISLMGYAGEHMNTVKQDFFHISEVAVEEMKNLLDGEKGRSVLLDFELVTLDYEEVMF